jgi:DNA mismatch endonuclease (patch repair protein)
MSDRTYKRDGRSPIPKDEQTSKTMSCIKGKNTRPEIVVRKYLFSKGYRYRINNRKLPGTPDITLAKYKTVIFINGCFWHGHKDCKISHIPKTHSEWWVQKIARTQERDKKNKALLLQAGWNVMTIWECQLKKNNIENILTQLCHQLEEYK